MACALAVQDEYGVHDRKTPNDSLHRTYPGVPGQASELKR
jgi:hypothetical protein